jgi:hypothetical protein
MSSLYYKQNVCNRCLSLAVALHSLASNISRLKRVESAIQAQGASVYSDALCYPALQDSESDRLRHISVGSCGQQSYHRRGQVRDFCKNVALFRSQLTGRALLDRGEKRDDERQLCGPSNPWLYRRANVRAGCRTGPIVRRSGEAVSISGLRGRNPGRGDDSRRAEGSIARRISTGLHCARGAHGRRSLRKTLRHLCIR